ncbi:hypothetical protein K501DRAFT_331161 [Backusella circina FSU 941]|nr:hypothetical protein K501DRAFT_331161 [Backusella circina FSU 941]
MSDFITRLQQTPISVMGTELDFNSWFSALTAVIVGFVMIYFAFFNATRQTSPIGDTKDIKSKSEVKERGIPQSNEKNSETASIQTPPEIKKSDKTPRLSDDEEVTQKSLPNTKEDTSKQTISLAVYSNGPFLAEFQATEALTILANQRYSLQFQNDGAANTSRIRRIVHSETRHSKVVQEEKEFVPVKDMAESKLQEGSIKEITVAVKGEKDSVKLEEVSREIPAEKKAMESVVQEEEPEIVIESEKQLVTSEQDTNKSARETHAAAVTKPIIQKEEQKVITEQDVVKSEEPSVSREIDTDAAEKVAQKDEPEIVSESNKEEVATSSEQVFAQSDEPIMTRDIHAVEPVIQEEEVEKVKEPESAIEEEKQEVSCEHESTKSEEPNVSGEMPVVYEKMVEEVAVEPEMMAESKKEVSTEHEQESVKLEEPIISREIGTTIEPIVQEEENKEPEIITESKKEEASSEGITLEKKEPSPVLAEFHATEAATLLASQTYSLQNATVNSIEVSTREVSDESPCSPEKVVKTDKKTDVGEDILENTSHEQVTSEPSLAGFHATEAATILANQTYSLDQTSKAPKIVMRNRVETSANLEISEKEDEKEIKKEEDAMQFIPEKSTVEICSNVSESKDQEVSTKENNAVKSDEPKREISAIDQQAIPVVADASIAVKEETATHEEEKSSPVEQEVSKEEKILPSKSAMQSIFAPIENNVNNGHHFETMDDGYMRYNGNFQMYANPKMMTDFAIPSDITPSSQPREKRYLTRLEKIDRQVQSYSPRMKARCTFWPNCTNKNCKYWHPVKECRMGMDCTFKNKCMFLHPDDMMEEQPRRRKPKPVNNKA